MAREHDRDTDKERQLRRWQKAQRHLVSRDEELRRKTASKAAHANRKDAPRRRDFDEHEEHDELARMRPRPHAPASPRDASALPMGTVTGVHANGIDIDGTPARLAPALLAPDTRPVVGDIVAFEATDGPPRAVAVMPRRSRLCRLDPGNENRELVLAANIDIAVVVVAAKDPPLRPGLIDRCLVALQRGDATPLVCVNKTDLLDADEHAALLAQLAPYRELGIAVCLVAATTSAGLDELRERLRNRVAVFLGHSGVGKSSLLNALDPDGQRAVGAVRAFDGKGRHTTTAASLRRLADGIAVIDTPGVRAFGVEAPTLEELRVAFADLAAFAVRCRFRDCRHGPEPECAVRAAVAAGLLPAARVASWHRLLTEP